MTITKAFGFEALTGTEKAAQTVRTFVADLIEASDPARRGLLSGGRSVEQVIDDFAKTEGLNAKTVSALKSGMSTAAVDGKVSVAEVMATLDAASGELGQIRLERADKTLGAATTLFKDIDALEGTSSDMWEAHAEYLPALAKLIDHVEETHMPKMKESAWDKVFPHKLPVELENGYGAEPSLSAPPVPDVFQRGELNIQGERVDVYIDNSKKEITIENKTVHNNSPSLLPKF